MTFTAPLQRGLHLLMTVCHAVIIGIYRGSNDDMFYFNPLFILFCSISDDLWIRPYSQFNLNSQIDPDSSKCSAIVYLFICPFITARPKQSNLTATSPKACDYIFTYVCFRFRSTFILPFLDADAVLLKDNNAYLHLLHFSNIKSKKRKPTLNRPVKRST